MSDVESLLKEKKVKYESRGADLLVHCFNPDHDDNNPSLRINRDGGQFHCLGCGYKGNVFSLFNKYRNMFNSKVRKTQSLIKALRKASWSGLEFPPGAFFIDYDFRGISKETVQKFQAFKTTDEFMEGRVVFPIYDSSNIIVGFQGRYEHSDANPRYLAYPAETALPWYPNIHRVEVTNSIILVEGLRDALVLHDKGIKNAVCIFGTKSVNMENIVQHLTPFLLLGTTKVFILMDGDAAGRSAATHLELCITRKTDVEAEIIELPDGVDPATMDADMIKSLKNQLKT
jgi:DNA primase